MSGSRSIEYVITMIDTIGARGLVEGVRGRSVALSFCIAELILIEAERKGSPRRMESESELEE
jgi:hypothetical protein